MNGRRPGGRQASFAASFLAGFAGQIAALVLSVSSSVVVARSLGPAGKGSVDLVVLISFLLALLGGVSLNAAGPYLVGRGRYPIRSLYGSFAGLWIGLTVAVLLLFGAVFATGLLAWITPSLDPELMFLAALMVPFNIGRQILGSLVLGLQYFIGYNAIGVVQAGVYLAAVGVLVWGLQGGALGAVAAGVLAQAASLIFVLVLLTHYIGLPGRLRWAPIREAVPFALKSHVGNLVQALNYRLDVLLLASIRDVEQVGFYTIAVSLAELLSYAGSASALVVFPRTAASPEEARALTPMVFRLTTLLTLGGAAGLALVGGPLILTVYGRAFEGSVVPLLLLLPAAVVQGAAKVLGADLLGRGHPEYNTVAAVLTLGVTIVFDLLLIGPYGASGASAACIMGYTASLVFTLIAFRRVTGILVRDLLRPRAADFAAVRSKLGRIAPSRVRGS